MSFYTKELSAIRKKGLLRERKIYSEELIDLASNDYLGISHINEPFEYTVSQLRAYHQFSPKASMLVNGYHQVHRDFEEYLARVHMFQRAITVGSGFLANLGLIESLIRGGDELFMDSEYHASGVVATRILKKRQVHIFQHNSMKKLRELLQNSKAKRKIIAVEGIYSMSGDIVPKDVFDIADEFNAILIVDEAHSFGVLGDSLMGVFDYYNIQPQPNHIKMGTLGKAVGSYGAYILASDEIISFLENRAKPIIYSTAPSLFDTLLAHFSIEYIFESILHFGKDIAERRELFNRRLGLDKKGLIFPIQMGSSEEVIRARDRILRNGFLVGAIRPPTVERPMLRVIARRDISLIDFKRFLEFIPESI
jgi:8-amino-7-oxononanoate synthase